MWRGWRNWRRRHGARNRSCLTTSAAQGDDGRGGADFGRGSGLAGLKDRIEALGGRISLHSPPGAGTTLQIALPLSGPSSPAWEN